jgi:TonB-dependent SusC/RagA subfamily outer membrane receptor
MRRRSMSERPTRSRFAALALGLAVALALLPSNAGAQQTGTVTGVVTDARSGQPVVGARVEIEGTRLADATNQAGQFRVANVPAGSQAVVVRRLGYVTSRRVVEIAPGAEVRLDLTIDHSAIQLDQVVVTGTAGGARVRTMGSSVTVIDAAQAQELARAPNLTSLLNARSPGLRLNLNSGRLGASPTINIRGRSSLGLGNAPLVYVDGVRVNSETGLGAAPIALGSQGSSIRGRLNDIHPDDIESIEVIKGPAAATIYGTEASNGVIQIITKRGSAGQAPRFNVRTQYGAVFFRDDEGRMYTNYLPGPGGEIVAWNAVRQERELGQPIFTRGHNSEVHASVSGGTDLVRYYASTAVRDDQGVEPHNSERQFSLSSNLDVALTSDLTLATSLSYAQIESHLGTDGGLSAMLGSVCGHEFLFTASRGFCLGFPPEVPQTLFDNSDETSRFTASAALSYQMTDWLSHRLLVGMDHVSSDARALERFAPEDLRVYLSPAQAAGRIGQTLRERRAVTVDYAGTATHDLSSSLSSRSSLGVQLDRLQARNSFLGGLGFPSAGLELVSATATRLDSSQSELVNTTIGAYLQQQFGWEDRVFLTAAVRVDNNSAFGEDLRWVTYPKVDASWMLSEESFWPVGDWVGTFRLRTAYGESGRAPNAFSALRTFSPVQAPGGVSGVTAGSLGNPNLKPERGKEWEVGFEAVVMDRVSLDFTWFTKRTDDLIVNQPVAPSSGFSGSVPRNLGRVDNSGYELSAGVQAYQGSRVAWEVHANLAVNDDEIKDLGELPGAIVAPGAANQVGFPIGGFWSRRIVSADFDPGTGQAINVLCDGGPGSGPVACADAPFVFLGPPVPKRTGALANTLTIGDRVQVYALVDWASGHVRWNVDNQLRCTGLVGAGVCEVNHFPERFAPELVAQSNFGAVLQGTMDRYYEDSSFVKLREVSVSYLFPEAWIPRASRASLTLSGRELATWTDFGGLDPENSGQAITPPLTRFTATFNVSF